MKLSQEMIIDLYTVIKIIYSVVRFNRNLKGALHLSFSTMTSSILIDR